MFSPLNMTGGKCGLPFFPPKQASARQSWLVKRTLTEMGTEPSVGLRGFGRIRPQALKGLALVSHILLKGSLGGFYGLQLIIADQVSGGLFLASFRTAISPG